MPEKEPQFNFSKQKNQEKFDALSKEQQKKIGDEAQREVKETSEAKEKMPQTNWEFYLGRHYQRPTEREVEVMTFISKAGNKPSTSRNDDSRTIREINGLKVAKERFDLSDEEYAFFLFNTANTRFLGGNTVEYGLEESKKILVDETKYCELLKYRFAVCLLSCNLYGGSPKNIILIWETLDTLMAKDEKRLFLANKKIADSAEAGLTERLAHDEPVGEYINMLSNEFQINLSLNKIFNKEVANKNWRAVLNLAFNIDSLRPSFDNFLNEQIKLAENGNLPFNQRRGAIDSIAGLIENGIDANQSMVKIIKQRSAEKEAPESKWGLSPIQESAFYTLMRLDNPDSNDALFGLLDNENVNTTVKYAVLKKLTRKDRNFLNKEAKEALNRWLYSKSPQELDWQDLQFVKSVLNDIPSTELRNKSKKQIARPFIDLSQNNESINKTWRENYDNIPKNTFLQLWQFAEGDEKLMSKFQNLYSVIRKEATVKENLLYGIVNSLEANPEILKLLLGKLKKVDFENKQDAESLNQLFRKIIFIDGIDNIANYSEYDDDEYYDEDEKKEEAQETELDHEITQIFSQEISDLKELSDLLQEVATKKIQEILPHKNITAEKIEKIRENWGDMEPIFTYLGRYPELKKYIAEAVAHIDSQENWKNWRYDLDNKTVKKQIGHLSEQQLEIWQGDYFSEIGDIMIAGESGAEKPGQIQSVLSEAVVTHKHIYDPERGQNKNEFIQRALEGVYGEINKNPDNQEEIIQKEIENILIDTKQIDTVIQADSIPRIEQSLQKIFPQGKKINLSKKAKDAIDFLSEFLPKESAKILKERYNEAEQQREETSGNDIIMPEIRQLLEQKIQEIQTKVKETENSDIWDKHAIDKTKLKNLGQFYQKRQELKATVDLLRLNGLSNKLIATNRIIEKEGKKGGETLLSVVGNLQKYFKDSPLQQDIKNIEFLLKEKSDLGEKKRLAMIFTDNPQMLWQVGKYPLGNGSCQHYAEGSYANQLMGYVGDANCKVAYLVDLNKLPQNIKEELNEKEFEEIKDKIPAQDLLNACVARSLIKMTKDKEKQPAILLEPTYSKVYKSDTAMDKYFNLFVDLMIAEPMKVKMARGGGKESIAKGLSRSPEGQYEDLDLSSVKFIHKLSKPTKEDNEIMERIRSSN